MNWNPALVVVCCCVGVSACSGGDSSSESNSSMSGSGGHQPGDGGGGGGGGSMKSAPTLPIEVAGVKAVASAKLSVPASAKLTGDVELWIQVHNFKFENMIGIQVNKSAWISLDDGIDGTPATVSLLGSALNYGGIGGGFSTLTLKVKLPPGTVVAGMNAVRFKLNSSDGRSSAFRVLDFGFVDAKDKTIVKASTSGEYEQEDPASWTPPLGDKASIAAGKDLWYSAPLTTNTGTAIHAHCTSCHAKDGRDLKYFNYSNETIEARAAFHGLSQHQGEQIASYIRSIDLGYPAPGRPWNPLYQPGPKLDSLPASQWSAGAGLGAVLDSEADMVDDMFPNGFDDKIFSAKGNLDAREVRVAVQFPDWNSWLPGTHPGDASFQDAFNASPLLTDYETLTKNLKVGDATVYAAQKDLFEQFDTDYYGLNQVQEGVVTSAGGTLADHTDEFYSLAQWSMVKHWEIMNGFELEGLGQAIAGPDADARSWYSNMPFNTSPHFLHFATQGDYATYQIIQPGLRNGTVQVSSYFAFVWYYLQVVLDTANGKTNFVGLADATPSDWPYTYGFAANNMVAMSSPQGAVTSLVLIKALQSANIAQTGRGPNVTPSSGGWNYNDNNLAWLMLDSGEWEGEKPGTQAALTQGLMKAWIAEIGQYTPQQWYAGGALTPSAAPTTYEAALTAESDPNVLPDIAWFMLPRARVLGVDPTVLSSWKQWGKMMWPSADWDTDAARTCNPNLSDDGTWPCQ